MYLGSAVSEKNARVLGNKFYVRVPRNPFFSVFPPNPVGFAITPAINHGFASNMLPKTGLLGGPGVHRAVSSRHAAPSRKK